MHHYDWQKKVSLRPGLLLLGLLLCAVVLPFAAAQAAGASPEVETTNRSGAKPEPRDLDERGHAAGVAALLNKRVLDNDIEKLLIIADPNTLGVMRGHYHGELEKRLVGEFAKTLTNADTSQIEQAIVAA